MFDFYSRLRDLFKRINVEKLDNGDYIAKDELTNLSAYGNSVDDAILNLKSKFNIIRIEKLAKKKLLIDKNNQIVNDIKQKSIKKKKSIEMKKKIDLKKKEIKINMKPSNQEPNNSNIQYVKRSFSGELVLHFVKLFITFTFFFIFFSFAVNLFLKNLEVRLSNIHIIERLENISNRFDKSLVELNGEIKEFRALEKLEHEIFDMADKKNDIDPVKQEKIIKSLKILKKRIKPFLDAFKE